MKKINSLFKGITFSVVLCGFSGLAFAQEEISDVAGLRNMDSNKDYVLKNDIDLTGVSLGECLLDTYRGTLDGNGHIIYGLKIDKSGSGEIGLFRHIRGGKVKNLGIENAYVLGSANVGAFAGQMHGGILENCYVSNSYISGRDHVGALIGQMEGQDGTGGIIRNCYATANVYSRENQGGGLVGTSTAGGGSILNSYFSGRLEVKSPNRAGGILALKDNDDPLKIENCVNLAVDVACGARYRIASINGKGNSTFTNNYALANLTFTNKESANVAVENGIDVTAARTLVKDFYVTDLHWTFDDATWKWIDGVYPVLSFQTVAVTSLVSLSESAPVLTLAEGTTLDLKTYYASGNGAPISYSVPANSKIKVTDGVAEFGDNASITDLEMAVVMASVTGFKPVNIQISLVPNELTVATANEFINKINAATTGNFKLTADIDFAGVEFNGLQNFSGKLDGNGHIIKNLNIQREGEGHLGLFWATTGAEIKNLGIESSVIGTAKNKHIGAIVGEMNGGSIAGCYVTNTQVAGLDHVGALAGQLKSAAQMVDCYSTAYVKTTGWQVGGLAGSISGKSVITNCYFSGVIVGNWNRTGGIVGLRNDASTNENTVENCVNMASYILGADNPKRIMGDAGITLKNNYSLASSRIGLSLATANAVTEVDATSQHGADITSEQAKSISFYTSSLKWNMTETWTIPVDGVSYPVLKWQTDRTDKIQTGIYKGMDALPAQVIENILLDASGYDLSKFISSNGLAFVYEVSNKNASLTGTLLSPAVAFGTAVVTGTAVGVNDKFAAPLITVNCKIIPESGVIEIETPSDLLMVSNLAGRDFALKNHIDMTDVTFTGLCSNDNPFTGTFDGKGFVITGLKFNESGTSMMGLFRKTKNATIKNVGLEDVNFVGNEDIGGIVGMAEGGKIEQCYVKNSTIEGRDRAAGIAARIYGGVQIENCYVMSTIKAREHQLGGIAGASFANATIKNCYFEGTLDGKYGHAGSMLGLIDADADVHIENCLNLAAAINSEKAYRIGNWGNRIGYAHFTNNYSISTTTGNQAVSDDRNGTNLSDDADAKSSVFYTNTLKWDFESIWAFEDGKEYPVLKVFSGDITGIVTHSINDDMVILSGTGCMEILSARATEVKIYSMDGRMVRSLTVNEGSNKIDGIASGLYLVNNHKVIVK